MRDFLLSLSIMIILCVGIYLSSISCPIVGAWCAGHFPTWCFWAFNCILISLMIIIGILPFNIALGISSVISHKISQEGKKIERTMLITSAVVGSGYYIYRLLSVMSNITKKFNEVDLSKLWTIEIILCELDVLVFIVGSIQISYEK